MRRDVLAGLLAAERAVGGLQEAVRRSADPPVRFDVWRREAIASARLDQSAVDWNDFVLGQIDPTFPAPAARAAAGDALVIWSLYSRSVAAPADRPPSGRRQSRPKGALPAPGLAILAAARASVRDLESWLSDQETTAAASDHQLSLAGLSGPPPLSAAWFQSAWARLRGAAAGPDDEEVGRTFALAVDEALREPGLIGVGAAFLRLHTPVAAVRHATVPALRLAGMSAEGRLARFALPFLMERACGLPAGAMALSPVLSGSAELYRWALSEGGEPFQGFLARTVQDACALEMARLATLERVRSQWRERVGPGREGGRLPALLDLLVELPAVTVRLVERRLGLSFAGASKLMQRLEDHRIVRLSHRRPGVRIFVADDLRTD